MHEKNKINILMVDDHPESLVALEAVLSRSNYNLVKANSGEEALRALLRMEFALILLDVRMPDLNGFEIARLIRQREKNRHIPIIFVTGYSKDTESITEGYLSGAVDYLMKPVDPDILRAKASFFIDLFIKNESVKQAGQHYAQLVETARVIVWRADAKSLEFSYVSREAENILGYAVSEWTSNADFLKDHMHPEDRERIVSAFFKTAEERAPSELEYRMVAADGRIVWFHNMLRVPEEDLEGSELIGIMLEITERKEAEEAIRRANEDLEQRVQERTIELQKMLTEKEMLLKEIHHRVKNNLQIISSLLSLQKNYVKNQDGWHVLNESQNRVFTMALIHEKLYKTNDLSEIDFSAYIVDLGATLFESYGIGPDRVKLSVQSAEALNIDTAIPCGLIVNELVTNALKYAFPDGRSGEITVSLTRNNGQFSMIVRDNGVGIPNDFDLRKTNSLGMRLVYTLTSQLRGTMDLERSPGTVLHIVFPESKGAPTHASAIA